MSEGQQFEDRFPRTLCDYSFEHYRQRCGEFDRTVSHWQECIREAQSQIDKSNAARRRFTDAYIRAQTERAKKGA